MLFERLYKAFGGVALAMFEAGSMVTTTYLIGGIAILLMAVLIPELVGLWNKLDEYFFAQVREVQTYIYTIHGLGRLVDTKLTTRKIVHRVSFKDDILMDQDGNVLKDRSLPAYIQRAWKPMVFELIRTRMGFGSFADLQEHKLCIPRTGRSFTIKFTIGVNPHEWIAAGLIGGYPPDLFVREAIKHAVIWIEYDEQERDLAERTTLTELGASKILQVIAEEEEEEAADEEGMSSPEVIETRALSGRQNNSEITLVESISSKLKELKDTVIEGLNAKVMAAEEAVISIDGPDDDSNLSESPRMQSPSKATSKIERPMVMQSRRHSHVQTRRPVLRSRSSQISRTRYEGRSNRSRSVCMVPRNNSSSGYIMLPIEQDEPMASVLARMRVYNGPSTTVGVPTCAPEEIKPRPLSSKFSFMLMRGGLTRSPRVAAESARNVNGIFQKNEYRHSFKEYEFNPRAQKIAGQAVELKLKKIGTKAKTALGKVFGGRRAVRV